MVTSRSVRVCLVASCVLVGGSPALAQQPPAEIHGGIVHISSISARPNVTLWGGGVDVEAVFDDAMVDAEECRPCRPGASIRLGGRITAQGQGTRFYEGAFTFVPSAPLTMPEADGPELILESAFSFQGQVSLTSSRNPNGDHLRQLDELYGAGTATARFSSVVDPGTNRRLYFFQDVTYRFLPAQ